MNGKQTKVSSRRSPLPYVLTAVFGAVAVGVYFLAVDPCRSQLARASKERGEVEQQLLRAGLDIKDAERVQKRLDELNTLLAPYREAMLTPVLESYAMAAKAVLDPFAADVNLEGVTYSEERARALPLSKPQSKQLHARKPIRMSCRGTYMDIISFVLRVEKELPLVSLQSLTITGDNANPERQAAVLVFEWPVKGGRKK